MKLGNCKYKSKKLYYEDKPTKYLSFQLKTNVKQKEQY